MIFFLMLNMIFATTRVAVIDTGYNTNKVTFPLCKDGHIDLTGTGFNDTYNHGKIISQLIADNASKPHCQVIVKYLDYFSSVDALETLAAALYHVQTKIKKVDIVNISSSSGLSPYNNKDLEFYIKTGIKNANIVLLGDKNLKNVLRERLMIKMLLDNGVKVVVASGNKAEQIKDSNCNIFPACHDPRIIVVGYKHDRFKRSNYGNFVDVYENGFKLKTVQGNMTGSSGATAIHTGKLIGK